MLYGKVKDELLAKVAKQILEKMVPLSRDVGVIESGDPSNESITLYFRPTDEFVSAMLTCHRGTMLLELVKVVKREDGSVARDTVDVIITDLDKFDWIEINDDCVISIDPRSHSSVVKTNIELPRTISFCIEKRVLKNGTVYVFSFRQD